jgi:DNA-binding Lrp family transcriptional regulator
MTAAQMTDSVSTDHVDRQIIHALQIHPRASFNRIALAVGTSEQTVARRYRRMRTDGILRVIGLVDPRRLGQTLWSVRLQCRPDAALQLARALARRDDIGWVTVMAGGSEISCQIRAMSRQIRDDLLLSQLPSASQVLSLTTHATLHQFGTEEADEWLAQDDLLDGEQQRLLGCASRAGLTRTAPSTEPLPLTPGDQPMLEVLARDGRASYATLAAATGWSENRVARRLTALHEANTVYFDVDVAMEAVGLGTSASLWLTVEPAHLAAAGAAIAAHREVPYAAAVTGRANLTASVVCRDVDELYAYVTTKIGAVEGVREVEVSPVLRRIKQAGALLAGSLLAEPTPRPASRRPRTERP